MDQLWRQYMVLADSAPKEYGQKKKAKEEKEKQWSLRTISMKTKFELFKIVWDRDNPEEMRVQVKNGNNLLSREW